LLLALAVALALVVALTLAVALALTAVSLALAVALALKQVKKPGDKNCFDVKRRVVENRWVWSIISECDRESVGIVENQ
jgi:hypothetical protein